MPTRRAGVWIVSMIVGWSALASQRLEALPRYSARYEQECALCHVNPTGGGMRTPYATKDLVPREFVMSAHAASPPLKLPSPPIEGVSFGVDLRQLYAASRPATGSLDFFLMQSDVYAAFQPDAKALLYLDRGLSGTFEAFGMYYGLPWKGYFKAGRFTAAYGWRFDDHTHFVRSELGFTPPTMSDVGVEAGIAPQGANLQVAVLNGNRGRTMGSDQRLAESVTGSARFRTGPVAASLGASVYLEKGLAAELMLVGGHSYLTLGRLAWVGEADLVRSEPIGALVTKRLAMTHEVSFMPLQGVEVIGTYDFFDPDIHQQSGVKDRWGAGLQFIPHSSLVLDGYLRSTHYVRGLAVDGVDAREVVLQAHFLY